MRWPADLMTKRGLLAAGVAAIGLLLIWALWPKPVEVEAADVASGRLLVTVDEEGKTRIKDVYTVSAPIGGKVVRTMLEAGDPVQKDVSIVVIIEPTAPPFLDVRAERELEAEIEARKSALALAEAETNQAAFELEFAQSDLTRAQALSKTRTIPERQLERARIDVETRKAALARAKANADVRRRELESTQARTIRPEEAWKGEVAAGCCVNLRAPVSGRVLRILQESERVVAAGTPILEIGDPGNLEIIVDLLSSDAVKVREGASASIEAWGGAPIAAKVTRIEPAGFTKISALGIEEQRVRVLLRTTAPAEATARLGHEFRVVAKIAIYEAPAVLQVPLSALFRTRDSWAVYTIERGRARVTPVEIGQRNTEMAEVLGGLKEKARVILHPSDRVTNGGRVSVLKPKL